MNDPFKIIEPTCIGFSGGRTSAYMLWRIIQSNGGLPDDCIVTFQNTGKEEEATLRFIRDCEINWGVKIYWIERVFDDVGFKMVNFETASRNGEPFEALVQKYKTLPNPVSRNCTGQLKIRAQALFVKSLGIFPDYGYSAIEKFGWVGIRKDEERRAARIADKSRIPLWTAGVTKEMIGDFWKAQPFDLGLPNMNGVTMHGNCDLCFLKPLPQILSLIAEKPERAIWWANLESMKLSKDPSGSIFRIDRPGYASMMQFNKEQIDMFDPNEEAIACFCGD
jgi:3'-phosphoadenosine 5'-phosphosulfate sulfotransferase (PAPS reductase)/FAD synthetase